MYSIAPVSVTHEVHISSVTILCTYSYIHNVYVYPIAPSVLAYWRVRAIRATLCKPPASEPPVSHPVLLLFEKIYFSNGKPYFRHKYLKFFEQIKLADETNHIFEQISNLSENAIRLNGEVIFSFHFPQCICSKTGRSKDFLFDGYCYQFGSSADPVFLKTIKDLGLRTFGL